MRRRWGFTFLYAAACALVIGFVMPVAAADYSPGIDRLGGAVETLTELAQRQDRCCKHCKKGQPCGNSCISTKYKCHQPPGCAC
jgi:hypothetical protein